MSDQDIFNEENKTDTADQQNGDDVTSVFADKLMAITKEDGTPKYDSIEKALDALKASQDHIKTLENDNRTHQQKIEELTAAANKVAELEEVIRTMSANGNMNNEEKPQGGNPTDTGGLSEQEAADLIKRILNEERQTSTAIENVKSVESKLVAKFGDAATANKAVKEKAQELGVDLAKLKELSATSPKAVLALFGESNSSPSATTSSVNTSGIQPKPSTLERPEKSILSGPGATDKNRMELMRKIKEEVYRKYGVTQ